MNILLVDDQEMIRTSLRKLLHISFPSIYVAEASSPDECLYILATKEIDLLLLDLDLGQNVIGVDVIKIIRKQMIPIKIIALSGYEEENLVREVLAAGASGYIVKGQESADFVARLTAVFENKVVIPESCATFGARLQNHTGGMRSDYMLSGLQLKALYYLCLGLSNGTIAQLLNLPESDVRRSVVSDILRIFGVSQRLDLIILISRLQLSVLPPEPP